MIRHAKIEDVSQLARIEAISYPTAESASEKSIENRVASFPNHFWLLEEGGKLCGFINGMVSNEPDLTDAMYDDAGMHDENGKWQMIFSVVTAPEFRGQGYAKAIMNQVIEDARKERRLGIVLTCKEQLLPFYAGFGFENEGLSESNHGDAIWYQMRLKF